MNTFENETGFIKLIQEEYRKAASYQQIDPQACLVTSRRIAETIAKRLIEQEFSLDTRGWMLHKMFNKLEECLPYYIIVSLRSLLAYGNLGAHFTGKEITPDYVQPCLQSLATVVDWYVNRSYAIPTNPYIAGSPIKNKDMFFGRDEIFEKIRTHLIGKYQDNIIVIHGQRRTGKTSILYQMEQRLNEHEERYVTVLIDLQGLSLKGIDNFLWSLAYTIQKALSVKYPIKSLERTAFQADARNIFRNDFLLSVQKAVGNRRLLLMFDEADFLDEAITHGELETDVVNYLRSLMQHQENLSFIFVRGNKFSRLNQECALMLNPALSVSVDLLDYASAYALVTQPVSELYTFENAAIERLLDITSCHPYFTQLLCQQLFILWEKKRWTQVTKGDVESILKKATERATVNFEYIWNESDPYQRLILAALAEITWQKLFLAAITEMTCPDCTPTILEHFFQEKQIPVKQTHVIHALEKLSNRKIIKSPVHLSFTVELLRIWLAREKPLSWVYSELQDELT